MNLCVNLFLASRSWISAWSFDKELLSFDIVYKPEEDHKLEPDKKQPKVSQVLNNIQKH